MKHPEQPLDLCPNCIEKCEIIMGIKFCRKEKWFSVSEDSLSDLRQVILEIREYQAKHKNALAEMTSEYQNKRLTDPKEKHFAESLRDFTDCWSEFGELDPDRIPKVDYNGEYRCPRFDDFRKYLIAVCDSSRYIREQKGPV